MRQVQGIADWVELMDQDDEKGIYTTVCKKAEEARAKKEPKPMSYMDSTQHMYKERLPRR